MAMNSVQTNVGAMVALASLNRTSEEMSTTQKRISTGFRVNDAKDDGAAFAVAQRVRGDIAGLGTANEQLGAAKGLLETTMGALNETSANLIKVRETLTKLSSDSISANDRITYTKDFENLVNQTNRALGDASYNNRSLLTSRDSVGGTADIDDAVNDANVTGVVRNERGSALAVTATLAATLTFDTRVATRGDGTGVNPSEFSLANSAGMTAEVARTMLGNATSDGTTALDTAIAVRTDAYGGAPQVLKTFAMVETAINTALSKFGADSRNIDGAMATNRSKMDAMNTGLGSLVDADLAKESARLQALQIRQQLGTQALSLANQTPQALLSLFR